MAVDDMKREKIISFTSCSDKVEALSSALKRTMICKYQYTYTPGPGDLKLDSFRFAQARVRAGESILIARACVPNSAGIH
jgi:hypothetical protein